MSKIEDVSPPGFTRVRGRWDYLKKRLLRRGVVEVNETHPHYHMLCALKSGIHTLLTQHPVAAFKDSLSEEDYRQKIKFTVSPSPGKTYTFESYAAPVFACLRAAVDVEHEDFLNNLAPDNKSYLEFISNSRSGQHFYFSHTQRFILKTDKHHCIQHFLSMLRGYINHFLTYPHSLLVKFLGLYSIQGPSVRTKKYFLVMQSVFYPTVRLQERYDLKGCLFNRYQDPNPPGAKTVIVLKDKNFLNEKIELGSQRDWFLTQLRADLDFLLSLRVLDYSLLLGRHDLHKSERQESVSNLVVRLKKSMGQDKTTKTKAEIVEAATLKEAGPGNEERTPISSPEHRPKSYDATSVNQVHPESIPLSCTSKTPAEVAQNRTEARSDMPQTNGPFKSSFLKSLSNKAYLDSTGISFQNRRLLINGDNALHIIDGGKVRYYVGVIDFFTLFQCRQRLGKFFKDIKTCCGNHSTEPPDVYADKFYRFIEERVV